jgi:hypothetical protein
MPDIIAADAMVVGGVGAAFYKDLGTTVVTPDIARLKRTKGFLLARKERLSVDPRWYVLMAMVGVAMHQDENEYMTLVIEGLERNPKNIQLAMMGAVYFLPKWHGSAEKLEQHARTVADRVAQAGGHGVYFNIYRQAFRLQYEYDLFKRSNLDWARMRQDIRDTLGVYPGIANINVSTMFACMAGDRKETRRLLKEHRLAYHKYEWLGDGFYDVCLAWALESAGGRDTIEH